MELIYLAALQPNSDAVKVLAAPANSAGLPWSGGKSLGANRSLLGVGFLGFFSWFPATGNILGIVSNDDRSRIGSIDGSEWDT